jgi:type II secretory pathway component PulL
VAQTSGKQSAAEIASTIPIPSRLASHAIQRNLVNLLTPGRRRRNRTTAYWLWLLVAVLVAGLVLVLVLR